MQGFEKIYVGRLFSGYLKWEVLGAWMTFKKAEMEKTLKNGLSMIGNEPPEPQLVPFCDFVGVNIAPV